MANFYAWDPCFTDPSWSCHDAPTFFGGGFDPYSSEFNCPDGCHTVQLGPGMRTKVGDLIRTRIKNTSGCAWAKSFLTTSLNYGRIRWYPYSDGNFGDAHWRNSDPSQNDIHIYSETWQNDTELVKTLIHEAAHIHFDLGAGKDAIAEGHANSCYVP